METQKRKTCLFCPNKLDRSREHIIPECLNGRLTSKDLICSNCNSIFGKHIDDDIKVQMNPVLLMMGFKNAQQFYVNSHDGKKYLMKKNMTMEPILPEIHVVKKKGRSSFRISGKRRDINNVLKKMNELLQTKIKGGKFIAEESKSRIGVIPRIYAPLELKITGTTILLFNKIALEFFALKAGDLSAVGGLLKKVRDLDPELANVVFCNKENEMRSFESDEISHLLFLQGDATTKTLRVYIELFNVFCGVVILADDYEGPDIEKYYYQNASTGKQIDTSPKLKIPLKDAISNVATSDDLATLLAMQSERHRERYLMEAVEMNLKAILDNLKDAEAKGDIKESEVANLYLKASANLIAELAFIIPYSIEIEEGKPPYEDDRYNFLQSNFKPEQVEDFLIKNKNLLNVKILIDGELFYFRSFHRESFWPVKTVELITIYIAAESAETKKLHYIPIRKVFEILNRARPMEDEEMNEYDIENPSQCS